jgi:hypothetical protein
MTQETYETLTQDSHVLAEIRTHIPRTKVRWQEWEGALKYRV